MDLRSIGTFNYEGYAKKLATQATTYTVGGIPLITYGCIGITASLLGVMFFNDSGSDQSKEDETAAKKEPEPETEVEPDEETPQKEEQKGGKRKKRKTRRKKSKRKKN
jgi:hypothetical protein